MAILSRPTITKGTPATLTLSKSEFHAMSLVSSHARFSDILNMKHVIFIYENDHGQKKRIDFDVETGSTFNAVLKTSTRLRSDFKLQDIVVLDQDKESFRITRAMLQAASINPVNEFDIVSAVVAPFAVINSMSYISAADSGLPQDSFLVQWSNPNNIQVVPQISTDGVNFSNVFMGTNSTPFRMWESDISAIEGTTYYFRFEKDGAYSNVVNALWPVSEVASNSFIRDFTTDEGMEPDESISGFYVAPSFGIDFDRFQKPNIATFYPDNFTPALYTNDSYQYRIRIHYSHLIDDNNEFMISASLGTYGGDIGMHTSEYLEFIHKGGNGSSNEIKIIFDYMDNSMGSAMYTHPEIRITRIEVLPY